MSKVVALRGEPLEKLLPKGPQQVPDPQLIASLEDILQRAKEGRLLSFIGIGLSDDERWVRIVEGDLGYYEQVGLVALLHRQVLHREGEDD